jgi:hypothetical protein
MWMPWVHKCKQCGYGCIDGEEYFSPSNDGYYCSQMCLDEAGEKWEVEDDEEG